MRIIQTVEGNLAWENYDIPTNDEIYSVIEILESELAKAESAKDSYKEKYEKVLRDIDDDNSLSELQDTLHVTQTQVLSLRKELLTANKEIERLRKELLCITDVKPIIIFV